MLAGAKSKWRYRVVTPEMFMKGVCYNLNIFTKPKIAMRQMINYFRWFYLLYLQKTCLLNCWTTPLPSSLVSLHRGNPNLRSSNHFTCGCFHQILPHPAESFKGVGSTNPRRKSTTLLPSAPELGIWTNATRNSNRRSGGANFHRPARNCRKTPRTSRHFGQRD